MSENITYFRIKYFPMKDNVKAKGHFFWIKVIFQFDVYICILAF